MTHVRSSRTTQGTPSAEIFKEKESEKKRKYQRRVLEVEMDSFTPVIFGTKGGMGEECKMFIKHLAEKLAEKDVECYPYVISWLRTRVSLEITFFVNYTAADLFL